MVPQLPDMKRGAPRFAGVGVCAFALALAFALAACGQGNAGAGTEAGVSDASMDEAAVAEVGPDATGGETVSEGGGDGCSPPTHTTIPDADLAIIGEPARAGAGGIYDPSLACPSDGSRCLFAYSSVLYPTDVHTRIAASVDRGASFQFVAEANAASAVTTVVSDGSCPAPCNVTLWHEVSSLVIDDTDPDPSRALKLFMHSYAVRDGGKTLERTWGYIGLQTAPIEGKTWSTEAKLLGWASPSDLSTSGVAMDVSAIAALSDCAALTEPGAMVSSRGIDLAVTCAVSATRFRVVLLRSTDHARSFRLVGTLLDGADVACLGAQSVNGADLFQAGGADYLMVTPIAPISIPAGVDYAGCWVIPIDDPLTARIARGAGGAPTIARSWAAADGRFAGPCTFAEAATGAGYLVPTVHPEAPTSAFRIERTGVAAP